MNPVQGGEPPKRADGGPEGTSPSSKTPKRTGKPDDFSDHLNVQSGNPAQDVAEANTAPNTAPPTGSTPQGLDSLTPQLSAPLSVSAYGDVKGVGNGKTSTGPAPTGKASSATSALGASPSKVSAGDLNATPTDLAEAVQAIVGRHGADDDAQSSADPSKDAARVDDPAPNATSAPPDAPQPDVFVANGVSATVTSSAAQASEAPSRTVTNLSAQIIDKLGEKVTRFDVALDPAGLGRVNVSVEISAKGQMSARLSFEHPEAAAALSKESGALRQALHDAGFQLKPEDLSFQSDGGFSDQGAASHWDDGARSGARANPFGAMSSFADAADLSAMNAAAGRNAAGGLDIRI